MTAATIAAKLGIAPADTPGFEAAISQAVQQLAESLPPPASRPNS